MDEHVRGVARTVRNRCAVGDRARRVLAVLGVLITAGMMVVAHNQGRGGDHMGRLGFVFGGMVLAGSAALLVNMVM